MLPLNTSLVTVLCDTYLSIRYLNLFTNLCTQHIILNPTSDNAKKMYLADTQQVSLSDSIAYRLVNGVLTGIHAGHSYK